jgi:hypothetical protein
VSATDIIFWLGLATIALNLGCIAMNVRASFRMRRLTEELKKQAAELRARCAELDGALTHPLPRLPGSIMRDDPPWPWRLN